MRKLFRVFRIILLLIIFVALAFYTKTQRLKSRNWSSPLQVVIYPMNSTNNAAVTDYITQLSNDDFAEIDTFFQDEAKNYGLSLKNPIKISLGPTLEKYPPPAPKPNASYTDILWWGLKFRYWSYMNTADKESNLHRIRLFLHYHPAEKNKQLKHSLGLEKGLLAIVHGFADKNQQQQNNIIIAHELLHTVGASDKYHSDGQPIFPHGYAEADKSPLYPQSLAEIMAAKIPASQTDAKMADSLADCIIGQKTAREINWLQLNSD